MISFLTSFSPPLGFSMPGWNSETLTTSTPAPRLPSWRTWRVLFDREDLFNEAHKTRTLKDKIPPTVFANFLEKFAGANGVMIDIMSGLRNITSAANVAAVPVAGAAIVGGTLMVAGGAGSMVESGKKLVADYKHENLEGGVVHGMQELQATSTVALGGSLAVANAATLAGATASAASAALALTVCGFVMYGLLGIRAVYGLVANFSFQSELTEEKEKEGLLSAMIWLANQVRDSETSKDELNKKLNQKWDQFAFRTSDDCCRMVRTKITKDLLERLEKKDPSAQKEAQEILTEVKRENEKQILKYTLLTVITAIGFAAFICSLILTGPVVPALFAFGAVLWLLIDSSDVHEKLGNWFCGKSKSETLSGALSKDLFVDKQKSEASFIEATREHFSSMDPISSLASFPTGGVASKTLIFV